MENFLILTLSGITFLNLIISICLIVKKRKKDKQNDINISMLRDSIASQKELLDDNVRNINIKITETSSELSKAMENFENKVKASFNDSAAHINRVDKKFNEDKEKLDKEIKSIGILLQELKKENFDKSEDYNKTTAELSKTMETFENKVKTSFDAEAAHINRVDKKFNEDKEKLDKEIKSIGILLQELKKESFDKSEDYNKKIADIENKLEIIVSDYKELKWQIENITKIREDSKRLNEETNELQQQALIEAIIGKINADKYSHKNEQKNTDPLEINGENVLQNSHDEISENDKMPQNHQKEKFFNECEISGKNSSEEKNTSVEQDLSIQTVSKQGTRTDGISLDGEQRRALECMQNTTGNYFITGKAGTGKSFLLKIFQSLTKKTILKVAPTGIAALNIDGVTIHSAFGFKNLNDVSIEELNQKTLSLSPAKKLVLENMDVLIIDEISMVRADIFDKIDKILRIVCQKEKFPFGGKQVLVFGDLFQLPPVADKNTEKYLIDKYGGIFFFNSDSYKNSNFSYIELRTNHRQKGDQKFFEILNKIREGRITDNDIDLVNERYVENSNDLRRVIKLYPKRELAVRVNEEALNRIWGEARSYDAQVIYNKYPDQTNNIENNFQISATLKLKIGAVVMMTRNDPNHRWVNGTLGIIEKMEANKIAVQINGYVYEIERAEFAMNEAIYKNGKITYNPIFKVSQFPMILAYAITIHKSQGNTYQQIACDPSDCFAPGQAYVALSRCVDLNGVYLLKKLDKTNVKVNSQVKAFYLSNNKDISTSLMPQK